MPHSPDNLKFQILYSCSPKELLISVLALFGVFLFRFNVECELIISLKLFQTPQTIYNTLLQQVQCQEKRNNINNTHLDDGALKKEIGRIPNN